MLTCGGGRVLPRLISLTPFMPDQFIKAIRGLSRTPAFSAIAVLTIALGVGLTTTVFCVIQRLLVRPLPYSAADRLVLVSEEYEGARSPMGGALLTSLTITRGDSHVRRSRISRCTQGATTALCSVTKEHGRSGPPFRPRCSACWGSRRHLADSSWRRKHRRGVTRSWSSATDGGVSVSVGVRMSSDGRLPSTGDHIRSSVSPRLSSGSLRTTFCCGRCTSRLRSFSTATLPSLCRPQSAV